MTKNFFETINAFAIVIKNNPISEYYFDYCSDSWKQARIKIQRFDAIIPKNLPKLKEINFGKKHIKKYDDINLVPDHTPTEKSCFYSHFKLWQESVYLNKPILIIEHDSFLENPDNLWYDVNYDIIFYDKGSMGAYVINPSYAKLLVNYTLDVKISSGPYAHIETFSVDVLKRPNYIVNLNPALPGNKKFKPATNQVFNDKIGNTIVKPSDILNISHLFPQHEFIKINE